VSRLLLIAALLTTALANAQGPLVLLDPARGGTENGAHVADRVDEKETTLVLAERISIMLRARGFTVEMTRDSDTTVSSDARAALANTTHPIACILLHATGTGTGIHLYTTTLHQTPPDATKPALWDAAQAPYAGRSRALAGDLLAAFTRSKMPVSSGQTWLRPLDNMQCPAVALEMAPMKDGTTADDITYNGHVADVIAAEMLLWRTRVQQLAPPPPPPVAAPIKPAAPPAATPAGTTP
jgi:N-acetylmuramoyl-L-alanine amidase